MYMCLEVQINFQEGFSYNLNTVQKAHILQSTEEDRPGKKPPLVAASSTYIEYTGAFLTRMIMLMMMVLLFMLWVPYPLPQLVLPQNSVVPTEFNKIYRIKV